MFSMTWLNARGWKQGHASRSGLAWSPGTMRFSGPLRSSYEVAQVTGRSDKPSRQLRCVKSNTNCVAVIVRVTLWIITDGYIYNGLNCCNFLSHHFPKFEHRLMVLPLLLCIQHGDHWVRDVRCSYCTADRRTSQCKRIHIFKMIIVSAEGPKLRHTVLCYIQKDEDDTFTAVPLTYFDTSFVFWSALINALNSWLASKTNLIT